MSDEFLGERRKALEEQFFQKESERQLERLRASLKNRENRKELSAATGITNEEILEKLAELGIRGGTLAALTLVPLVEVAWAGGRVEDGERRAILSAAAEAGIQEDSPGFALLESWLDRRPDASMLDAWTAYIAGLCEHLDADQRASLKSDLLGRARSVAEAAGGFLGLGNRVSPEEAAMLGVLARAFPQ